MVTTALGSGSQQYWTVSFRARQGAEFCASCMRIPAGQTDE